MKVIDKKKTTTPAPANLRIYTLHLPITSNTKHKDRTPIDLPHTETCMPRAACSPTYRYSPICKATAPCATRAANTSPIFFGTKLLPTASGKRSCSKRFRNCSPPLRNRLVPRDVRWAAISHPWLGYWPFHVRPDFWQPWLVWC